MRPAGYYPYPPPSCQPLGAKVTDRADQQYYFWIAKSIFWLKNLLNAFHYNKELILSPHAMKRYDHLSN